MSENFDPLPVAVQRRCDICGLWPVLFLSTEEPPFMCSGCEERAQETESMDTAEASYIEESS